LVQPAACAGLLGNASLLIATYGKIGRKIGPGRIDADVGGGAHGASGAAMTKLQHFSRFKALRASRLNGQS
jgi:hypothetical protein